jgi:PAP2 superfamily
VQDDQPSLYWTRTSLDLIAKYQLNPLRASRVLTLLHCAMHDALVQGVRGGGDERLAWVAVHRAASLILADLFPQESPERLEAKGLLAAATLAESHPDQAIVMWTIGGEVARDASARARSDGSDRVWPLDGRPAPAPGRWVPTPPIHSYNPLEPLAGEWRPWVLPHGGALEPPEPVPYDSPAFWKEVEEVRRTADSLTPAQKAIADAWNLDRGTVTPAGVWNLKADDLARAGKLSPPETLRLFASLNVAMMDAFIACWHAKYKWWTIRPVSVIRDRYEPEFLSYLITPPFPAYPSGHASASGAAEVVLARFFPESAGWLKAQAEEAAMSRLFGGIHYRSDNEAGLELGRSVGREVLQRTFAEGTSASPRGPNPVGQ